MTRPSAFVRGLIQERDALQRRIDELEALAAQEAREHDGSCCAHPDAIGWRRDTYRQEVCICDHGRAEHRIDLKTQACDHGGCLCKSFALCHTTVAEHRTVRETP